MTKDRVLVTDDETEMRELLQLYLQDAGFEVRQAQNGREALQRLSEENFDLIIIDLMMPEMDGWTLCQEIRRSSDIPIIILTARGEEFNRVLGFDLGADDYVTKPFSPKELLGRVRALLRRTKTTTRETGVLDYPGIRIDSESHEVTVNGNRLALTPKEFDLLHFLASSPGKVFTREHLLDRVWGYSFEGGTRTVDTHIKSLRSKLSQAGWPETNIVTVWGVGYKFEGGTAGNPE